MILFISWERTQVEGSCGSLCRSSWKFTGKYSATIKMVAIKKSLVDEMRSRSSGSQRLPQSTLKTGFEFISDLIVHVQMLPYKG